MKTNKDLLNLLVDQLDRWPTATQWWEGSDDGMVMIENHSTFATCAHNGIVLRCTKAEWEAAKGGLWTEWNGGEMPIAEGTLVDVKYRDGNEEFGIPAGVRIAGRRHAQWWVHDDDADTDIVAYRLSADSIGGRVDRGVKFDSGKPRVSLVLGGFSRALEAVSEVGTFGANKYTDDGWLSVPDGVARYSDAHLRHILKEQQGEVNDPESGLSHAAHTAWNALARLELLLRK